MHLNFNPFPTLLTDRLVLRSLNMHDENEIFFLRSDERVLKYTEVPKAENIDDARKFITKINTLVSNNESVLWTITLKESNKLIGTICLWNISEANSTADIGYVLHPGSWGKGIMQEALLKVIEYGFKIMQLNIIDAEVHPNNLKSIKLLERNGFTLSMKSEDTVIYSLSKKS